MKKPHIHHAVLAFAATAALLTGGCASVEISSPRSLEGVEIKGTNPGDYNRVIVLENDGYFLFSYIPLIAGNMKWDTKRQCIKNGPSLFYTETTIQPMLDTLYNYAERENCDVVDVIINNRTEYGFDLTSLTGLFKAVIGCEPINVSAVLRARGTSSAATSTNAN